MTTYLFGDTDLAAQRLRLVAEAYGEATRAFVHECGLRQPGLVVDLGCGRGIRRAAGGGTPGDAYCRPR